MQWQLSVRETGSKRDKEAAKQAQCSTAVQTAAAASGCSRTDRAASTISAPGSQSSRTAPDPLLERKPGHVGGNAWFPIAQELQDTGWEQRR